MCAPETQTSAFISWFQTPPGTFQIAQRAQSSVTQGMGRTAIVQRPQNPPLLQTKTIKYTMSTRLHYPAQEMNG